MTIKNKITLTLLLIINLILYIIINCIIPEITLNFAQECYRLILYNHIVNNKDILGTLTVEIENYNIILDKYFYITTTLNNNNITTFFMTLNWEDYAYNNNVTETSKNIIKEYLNYIAILEEKNNFLLYYNLADARDYALQKLYTFVAEDLILPNKENYLNYSYLQNVLNNIDLFSYCKTVDFQSGRCLILKDYCHDMIKKAYIETKEIANENLSFFEPYLFITEIKNIIVSRILLHFSLNTLDVLILTAFKENIILNAIPIMIDITYKTTKQVISPFEARRYVLFFISKYGIKALYNSIKNYVPYDIDLD